LKVPVAEIGGRVENTFVLVGGHICSWWEGITDNGTGNACALELARVLHQHRENLARSVRIAWWSGHSQGRYSASTWYADAMWPELDEHCIAYLNIDSPGVRNATEYTIRAMAELETFNKTVVEEMTGKPIAGYYAGKRRPPRTSDQSFWGVGIPSMRVSSMIPADHPDYGRMPGSGGGWWHHTADDTLDKAGLDVLEADTQIMAALLVRLLNARVLPWRPVSMAEEVRGRLDELVEAAAGRFNMSRSVQLAAKLLELTKRLEQEMDSVEEESGVASVNACLVRLSKTVNPVLRTEVGRFGQEPTTAKPLFPGLSHVLELADHPSESDAYGFTLTQVQREHNRVVDCLGRAVEIVAAVLRQE